MVLFVAIASTKGWPAVRLAVVPKIGTSLVLLFESLHLPDPNSKRLRKILNLGTTASLKASSPLGECRISRLSLHFTLDSLTLSWWSHIARRNWYHMRPEADKNLCCGLTLQEGRDIIWVLMESFVLLWRPASSVSKKSLPSRKPLFSEWWAGYQVKHYLNLCSFCHKFC